MSTRASVPKRSLSTFAWVETALVVAASVLLIRAAGQIRSLRTSPLAMRATQEANVLSLVGKHQSLLGKNAFGRSADTNIPPHTKWAVIFVVRYRTYSSDVAYWTRVAALLPASAHVWLLGFCDGSLCNTHTRTSGTPGFDLIADGEIDGVESAYRADQAGDLIVANAAATITSLYPWRDRTPEATAAHLGYLQ